MQTIKIGYKQTDIGIIPEEWEVKKLGDCLLQNPDYGINAPATSFSDNLPVYLRITDISNEGRFDFKNRASVNDSKSGNYILNNDEIVFARTGASVGKTYLYNPNDGKLVFAGFLIRAKINTNILNSLFLKGVTETNFYWNWVKVMSMRSGQPGINGVEYSQLQIPVPPLEEQKRIAQALSDIDGLITNLEELIAKKQSLKQGAMQELLKPKRGLGGEKVGEVLTVRHGKSQKEIEIANGKYPILGTGGIMGSTNHFLYDKESVLIGRKGTIDKPRFMNIPFWTVDTLFYTEIDNKFSPKFIYYHFLMIDWYSYNEASGVPSLNGKTIEKIKITFPPLPEQKRIAKILSEIDEEIAILEGKRAKYQQFKTGMMQELLTGKIRLT